MSENIIILVFQTLNNALKEPNEPVNDENFFDCIETLVHNQRLMEDNLKQLPILLKANDRKKFATTIDEINDALTALQGYFVMIRCLKHATRYIQHV